MSVLQKLGTEIAFFKVRSARIISRPCVLRSPHISFLGRPLFTLSQHTNYLPKRNFKVSLGFRQNEGLHRIAITRSFHVSPIRKLMNSPNSGQGGPRFKVYKISPSFILLTGIGFFALVVTILPILFTSLLPLVIIGIVVHQFNKWRRNTLYSQILKGLKSSNIRTNMRTINSLHVADVQRIAQMESTNSDVFRSFFRDRDFGSDTGNVRSANHLKQFVKDRVLEAIQADENGIRTYFLGNDVDAWLREDYDLVIDTDNNTTFSANYESNLLVQIKYPLYLKSSKSPMKHLANVVIVALPTADPKINNSNYLQFLMTIPSSDSECKLVIAVQALSGLLLKQFIITNTGKSGDYSKYDISETQDGHTEYTINL